MKSWQRHQQSPTDRRLLKPSGWLAVCAVAAISVLWALSQGEPVLELHPESPSGVWVDDFVCLSNGRRILIVKVDETFQIMQQRSDRTVCSCYISSRALDHYSTLLRLTDSISPDGKWMLQFQGGVADFYRIDNPYHTQLRIPSDSSKMPRFVAWLADRPHQWLLLRRDPVTKLVYTAQVRDAESLRPVLTLSCEKESVLQASGLTEYRLDSSSANTSLDIGKDHRLNLDFVDARSGFRLTKQTVFELPANDLECMDIQLSPDNDKIGVIVRSSSMPSLWEQLLGFILRRQAGRAIAYGIWLLDLKTGETKLLGNVPRATDHDRPSYLTWTRDGRKLNFLRNHRIWSVVVP